MYYNLLIINIIYHIRASRESLVVTLTEQLLSIYFSRGADANFGKAVTTPEPATDAIAGRKVDARHEVNASRWLFFSTLRLKTVYRRGHDFSSTGCTWSERTQYRRTQTMM